jgi:hypothetical protein
MHFLLGLVLAIWLAHPAAAQSAAPSGGDRVWRCTVLTESAVNDQGWTEIVETTAPRTLSFESATGIFRWQGGRPVPYDVIRRGSAGTGFAEPIYALRIEHGDPPTFHVLTITLGSTPVVFTYHDALGWLTGTCDAEAISAYTIH